MKLYARQRSAQQLVKLMMEHRIEYAVLCPGSRNAPLLETLVSQMEIRAISVADERSAGFQAIGIALVQHKPVAVVCTSGSALANLLPAVAEAYYREIPLLIISADRPPALIGQQLGQTLPQPSLLGTLTQYAVDLPEVHNKETEWHCNRLLNDAFLRLQTPPFGPIHINIPLSEPLFEYESGVLPETRVIHDLQTRQSFDHTVFRDLWHSHEKKMILVGQYNPTVHEENLLSLLCQRGDCVVLGDAFSNVVPLGAYPVSDFRIKNLTEDNSKAILPDFLITLGGQVVSKPWRILLQNHHGCCHLRVSQHVHNIDPYRSLNYRVPVSIDRFIETLLDIPTDPHNHYSDNWDIFFNSISQPEYTPYSNGDIIEKMVSALPKHAVLHVGNSSLARDVQEFIFPRGVKCHANRGTNGIEGSMSVAVGAATADDKEHILLIGDLSFFYDLNALWKNTVPQNLTIIMLNNGGGAIFKHLNGMKKGEIFDRFVAYRHKTSAKGWAVETGFEYHAVHNEKELTILQSLWQFPHSSARFLEIFMDWNENNENKNQ